MPDLRVKSHVARDLLQTALAFGDVPKAVWEYVANGLEYVREGVNPKVQVSVNRQQRRIEITDNGRGMDWVGLQNFFTMHGENVDRLAGRPGRGRFGTGKCAAFGIAKCLRVATVRNRLLSCVELRREAVEACNSGNEIPVAILANSTAADQPDGTQITIEQISAPIDQQKIIWLIQRHLTHWARNATVYVGDHFCQPRIPEATITQTFSPTDQVKAVLGDVTLTVKAAAGLNDYTRGIAIYSKGIWHATRLEGCERLVFGEIDVPKLEEDSSVVSPFDATRNQTLNINNPLVKALFRFIDEGVRTVRQQWESEQKKLRESDERKRLEEHARRIASVINRDFRTAKGRLPRVPAGPVHGPDFGNETGGGNGRSIVYGGSIPARIDSPVSFQPSSPSPYPSPSHGGSVKPPLIRDEKAEKIGATDPSDRGDISSEGGFTVRYERLGQSNERSIYQREERAILINLDHPQLEAAAKSSCASSPTFRRLATEIAIVEYALALTTERASQPAAYVDILDSLIDTRDTLDRITREAAELYE